MQRGDVAGLILRVAVNHARADARRHVHRPVTDRGHRGEYRVDALRDGQHGRPVRHVAREDDELVAAEARDRVRLAHAARQQRGEVLQQQVAGCMAVGVVHFLEAVEIDQEQRARTVVAFGDRRHRAADGLFQRVAVREAGERIGRCLAREHAIGAAEPVDQHAQIHRRPEHRERDAERRRAVGFPPRLPCRERRDGRERRDAGDGERRLAVAAARTDQKPEDDPQERQAHRSAERETACDERLVGDGRDHEPDA